MRFDKPRHFRQSMSWVHTWTGLVMGWLLFAIYVTGGLSYFRNEITLWMQPELHAAAAGDDWLPKALGLLAEKGAGAQQWTISPPGPRSPVVGLSYREAVPQGGGGGEAQEESAAGETERSRPGRAAGERSAERSDGGREAANPANGPRDERTANPGNAEARAGGGEMRQGQQGPQERNRGVKRLTMDPSTGSVLEPRATAGGNFLYRFHYQLHGMDRTWGQWIVGAVTMLMFVAIITGVVVHRNIFKDFFTFRPAKGKRSWLDGHNATGVLSLPFHVVITFSGLLLLATQLMPWAMDAAYNGDRRAFSQELRGGGGRDAAAAGQAAGRRGAGGRAPLADLRPLYRQALERWPDHGVGNIVVNNPGTSQATVEMRQAFGERLTARGGGRMLFDGATGNELDPPAAARPPTNTRAIWNVFVAVHEGRFAMPAVRWLLFVSGVLGALMIASGLVLWLASRQKEREALGYLPRGHRFVEIMNVGAIAGLMIALAAYFWANRFIPAAAGDRGEQEILSFFAVWGLTFAHAAVRRHKRAWVEQLSAGAALFLLLPALNGLTGGAHLGRSMLNGPWQVAGFDLAALFVGGALLFVAYRVQHHVPRPARKEAGRPAAGGSAGEPHLSLEPN